MQGKYKDSLIELGKNGYIEHTECLYTGNRANYFATAGSPLIFSPKGFLLLAHIFATRVNNALIPKMKPLLFDPLIDIKPLHHNCDYNDKIFEQFTQLIQVELEIGQIQFIPIFGGHATIMMRERLQDGSYIYYHLDSSTGAGGIYKPADRLYTAIRKAHADARIVACYDRTQKTSPGCHTQTLQMMLEFGLSLARGDKTSLLDFIVVLEPDEIDRITRVSKTNLPSEQLARLDSVPYDELTPKEQTRYKQEQVIKRLIQLKEEPNHIEYVGLPPEALFIAQTREIFSAIKTRRKEIDPRADRLLKKITKHLDPTNDRFNLKIRDSLNKMLQLLVGYHNRSQIKSNEFVIEAKDIEDDVIAELAALTGKSENLLYQDPMPTFDKADFRM